MSGSVLAVEDRLDILELLARADDAASNRDADAYVALFTDDASLEGQQGLHHGTAALRSAVAGVWAGEPAGSRHLTLNAVLAPFAGRPDLVLATSTLLIVAANPTPRIATLAAITQVVARIDGRWRIQRRTIGA